MPNIVKLNAVMLYVIILNVIMLRVGFHKIWAP
jgi:hypothetical protein